MWFYNLTLGSSGANPPLSRCCSLESMGTFEEESSTPPEWRMVFRILKNANLSPRWIELDKEVRSELAEARNGLRRNLTIFGCQGECWETALRKFTLRITQLNEIKRGLNLIVPRAQFQRRTLPPDEDIERALF